MLILIKNKRINVMKKNSIISDWLNENSDSVIDNYIEKNLSLCEKIREVLIDKKNTEDDLDYNEISKKIQIWINELDPIKFILNLNEITN